MNPAFSSALLLLPLVLYTLHALWRLIASDNLTAALAFALAFLMVGIVCRLALPTLPMVPVWLPLLYPYAWVGTGALLLYRGQAGGTLAAARTIGTGWGSVAALSGPGDLGGDGPGDVVVVDQTGALRRYGWNGTGLADALLEATIGDRAAYLWVIEGNERAMAYYRKRGFADDGGRDVDQESGATEIRMVRSQPTAN